MKRGVLVLARLAVNRPVCRRISDRVALCGLIAALALLPLRLAGRTLEFDTNEVTLPGLAATPDGRFVVFNLLGHLFRMPASGGDATQLTFGPNYDSDPAVSPDGARVAFVSNRDGSDGNLFLLELSSGRITQLTHEFQVSSPAWSPDGKTLAFISNLRREEYTLERTPVLGAGDSGTIMTVPAQGGGSRRITGPGAFVSVFFLPGGRLAWTSSVLGPARLSGPRAAWPVTATNLEATTQQGKVSRIGSLQGGIGPAALEPDGRGVYFVSGGQLRQYRFGDSDSHQVGPLQSGNPPRLVASPDGSQLYAAADAQLWRITLANASRTRIAWHAHVKMEVAEPVVRQWTPPSGRTFSPRAILTPRLSPDGRTLVFMAAGSLWEQSLAGGEARRIIDEIAFQCEPAFSPDGQSLAFVSDKKGKRELRVFDFSTRRDRTLASVGGASWLLFPSWSSDGKSIVIQRTDGIRAPYRLIRLDAATGAQMELTRTTGSWTARPHLSSDGGALYYTARVSQVAAFFKLALAPGTAPVALTQFSRHVNDGLVSPDGKWFAFRRNTAIWIAPMGSRTLTDADVRLFSEEGGRSFAFTPDASALIYSEGPHVWRRPVAGGPASEIPIRLMLRRAEAPPLLISRARVLDVNSGRFSAESSLYIENGRIRWVGPEKAGAVASNAVRLDAAGRFAIPGLTDSHTHTAWANQQITEDSLVAYGVTSVRDTGSRLDLINALRDRRESTHLPIPRYFASGDIFEGVAPVWGDAFLQIATPDEARAYVARWKNLGADFLKVYASLPWYIKTAAAEEARRQGLPAVGHGTTVEEIVRSVTLGFATLEHTGPWNDDIIHLLTASGVKLDPTLTTGVGTRTLMGGDPPAGVDQKFRTFIPADALQAARPGSGMTPQEGANWSQILARVQRAYRGGARLLDGTDALMTGVFFGPSLHWELQFLNQADIPAAELLRMATADAAQIEGASAYLGSLDPGRFGDLLLLDANPLEDIRNTMKIWRVIEGGDIFDPAAMR